MMKRLVTIAMLSASACASDALPDAPLAGMLGGEPFTIVSGFGQVDYDPPRLTTWLFDSEVTCDGETSYVRYVGVDAPAAVGTYNGEQGASLVYWRGNTPPLNDLTATIQIESLTATRVIGRVVSSEFSDDPDDSVLGRFDVPLCPLQSSVEVAPQ